MPENGDMVDPATEPATTVDGHPMPPLVHWVPPVPTVSAYDLPGVGADGEGPRLPLAAEDARAKYEQAMTDDMRRQQGE